MSKIWATLFASAGDKITIPVAAEPDGSISVTQGWPSDYELPDTDPRYKPVGREEMNGVFNEVTDSIKQLQLQGAAEWSSLLGAYPKGAEVIHSGERWYNTTAGNTTTPGVGANWINVRTVASETVAGIARNATQVEMDAGAAGNFSATPAKLRNGFAISLTANGYIKLPSWLSGLIIQWGTQPAVPTTSPGTTYPLNITFPNAALTVVCSHGGPSGTVLATCAASVTTTQVTLRTTTLAIVNWIAIGY